MTQLKINPMETYDARTMQVVSVFFKMETQFGTTIHIAQVETREEIEKIERCDGTMDSMQAIGWTDAELIPSGPWKAQMDGLIDKANLATKVTWEKATGGWSNGETIHVNGIRLGGYYYDPMQPKGDPKCYGISSDLPRFAPKVSHYSSADEAKKALEGFVLRWFKKFQ